MGRPKVGEVRKLQVALPVRSFERLDRMVAIGDHSSYKEVISNALRLYEACLEALADGGDVILRDRHGVDTKAFLGP
ncbi:MAG: hypothetical protein ACR2QF_03095 [Geminicoccaceae bacterium]